MKKNIIRILVIGLALAIVGVVVLTLSLGSIVKKGVETVGPQLTKTKLTLDGASLSLLSGSGGLDGLFVGNPAGFNTESAIKLGHASLGVKPMSVFSDKIHVTQVRVVGPEITFEGNLQGNNLSKILENVQAVAGDTGSKEGEKDKAGSKGAAKKIQVDDFLISGAQVHLSTSLLGGKAVTVTLPDIHLTDIGTGEGVNVAQMTEKVMNALTKATLEAVQKSVADVGKVAAGAVKDLTKGGTNSIKDVSKSIGNLFKK